MSSTRSSTEQDQSYLQVRSASKRFGAFQALEDVSFSIAAGEFVCFLGPSGCGKTTLLRCIAGLETLSAGQVVQAGRDITSLPASARDFGIVFQSYALFPNLTVSENVAFGLVGSGLASAEIARRVEGLLELVGLAGHEKKYPGQLSGGQQQRVALARALVTRPQLLLADEPTGNLDPRNADAALALIHEQAQIDQTALLLVTHSGSAAATAQRRLRLNAGVLDEV